MTEIFEQGYALLVGVGECEEKKLSLPVTVKDTQAIYAALTDAELCAYPHSFPYFYGCLISLKKREK
ncbi:hypothetical protein [Crocosphaera sp.]|uniref:hypothetical protein n=1 Tax=Crocosphaera sp. TaxID=2729996 RepID=UPI003F1F4FEF